MIHYHGGPITPVDVGYRIWKGRHAFISFGNPEQITLAAEVCQSFALDNGAYSFWKTKKKIDWSAYYEWCKIWLRHPGCDWAVIPDVIEGTESQNDELVDKWPFGMRGVPVWHTNESVERLIRLSKWPRVAIGSSGEYDAKNVNKCVGRLCDVLPHICDKKTGFPKTKLHGMRMLNPDIFTQVPLASADSTNVAFNIKLDLNWGPAAPRSRIVRGMVILDRVEFFNSPASVPKLAKKLKGFGI